VLLGCYGSAPCIFFIRTQCCFWPQKHACSHCCYPINFPCTTTCGTDNILVCSFLKIEHIPCMSCTFSIFLLLYSCSGLTLLYVSLIFANIACWTWLGVVFGHELFMNRNRALMTYSEDCYADGLRVV